MRTAFGAVLAVGVALAATAARADDKPEKVDAKKLVGRWEPADAPKAVKVVIEFTKDGKLAIEVDFGGKAEKTTGTYKVDGNKLSVTMKKGDGKERSESMTVTKLTDDELVMEEDGKKKSETLKRIKDKK